MIDDVLLKKLIDNGESIKSLRMALLEASRNFAPGSVADLVFNFYKALRQYYSDLLIYQFQLYSDRPKYALNVFAIKVLLDDGLVRCFLFNKGNGADLSDLGVLNDVPLDKVAELSFEFVLSPELKHLMAGIENNPNKDLFSKAKEVSVAKGDGTFVTGRFEPEWSDARLKLSCVGFVKDSAVADKMFALSGGTI